jgi:hypothetical protein
MHPRFSNLSNHLCIDVPGGGSVQNSFLKACLTLALEFVFAYSITQKLFSMEDVISENCAAWQ